MRKLIFYIALSVAIHLLALFSLGRFGSYSFAGPVNNLQAVMVELAKTGDHAVPERDSAEPDTCSAENETEEVAEDNEHAQIQTGDFSPTPVVVEKTPTEPKSIEPAAIINQKMEITARAGNPAPAPKPAAIRHILLAQEIPPPLRTAGEFISSKSEKLSYLISVLGIPVGSMELEAINENGAVRITLRTRSNSALSSVYPVDDLMETRHLGGNFIISKIRQKEGSFSSDIGFTIFLRDKRVFWIDRIRNRVSDETIPNSEVLDTLSSFYFLRNRPLQTGKTEILHIYDGDTYAPVPVEILRQEEVRLRNGRKVDTLLLRHIKQKGGIFRRTGDMLIWLTDDANRVPVKLETTTPVGKVTVELVSAETQQPDNPGTQKSFPPVPYSATSTIP
jgi:hypothetical protein